MDTTTPSPTPATPEPTELRALRDRIDEVDSQILELMARRFGFARETMGVKARHGLHVVDTRREAEVVRQAAVRAREWGIEPELVREIFWRLIELSRLAQSSTPQAAGSYPACAE